MSEVVRDSVIKLFGKTISFSPENSVGDTISKQSSSATSNSSSDYKDVSEVFTENKHDDSCIPPAEDMMADAATSSRISDESKNPDSNKSSISPTTPTNEEPSEGSNISSEKTLKKPDKILPCPRCNSMDTKFCYYNNYNVSQPRHFCKNCQRYWTAGGTMRNVPVGSGRRKSKTVFNPNYGQIMVSNGFQAAQVDSRNGIQFASPQPSGFLVFGSEGSQNCVPNYSYEHSSKSSNQNSMEKEANKGTQESRVQMPQNMPSQVPIFPQLTWPCQWNNSGVPITFYPAAPYWGCAVQNPVNGHPVPPKSSSDPSTPTSALRKHPREETIRSSNSQQENMSCKISEERSVLIPKTLRIDDPSEAAKSSIWSTLGFKNEKIGSINGKSPFKAFATKADRHMIIDNASMVLHANPAALSRSLNFHEST